MTFLLRPLAGLVGTAVVFTSLSALAQTKPTADAAKPATTIAAPTSTAPSTAPSGTTGLRIRLPEVVLNDHRGMQRRLPKDWPAGGVTLVHFFYTGCTSICSPLTAIVKAARDELLAAGVKDVQVVSVSVDPLNDTPARLADYAKRLDIGQSGWSLTTASVAHTEALLKAFGVPLGGNIEDHTPMVFVGQAGGTRWSRAYGLAGPKAIVDRVMADRVAERPADRSPDRSAEARAAVDAAVPPTMRTAIAQQAAAAQPTKLADRDPAAYFTNLPVLNQERRTLRFYDDLVRNRVVLVNAFYTGCRDVCSPMTFNLAQAQQRLAGLPQLGPVTLVSLSVDAVADTPEVLSEYGKRHGALPGWHFVTGKKENVDWVLHKLGLYVPEKEQHQAALWVGNDKTQTWVKLHALATPDAIVAAVRKVAPPADKP